MGIIFYNYRKDINTYEVERLQHCYSITNDLIRNDLDNRLIKELWYANNKDFEALCDNLVNEVYRILYGKVGNLKPTIKEVNELDLFVEDQLRRNDCSYFAKTVLNKFDINWHHLEWSLLIQKYNYICLLAARDHGKSYFWSLAYPLWRAYKYNKMSSNTYDLLGRLGYIFTMSQTRAGETLEILKDEVEDNDFLREYLYPENEGRWSVLDIKFKNGATLRARSFGRGQGRGAHPGFIIADDCIQDDVLYSQVQRQKDIDWFNGVIMGMLVPNGQLIVVGTPFHFKDFYSTKKPETEKQRKNSDVLYKEKGFYYKEYPAIDDNGRILWSDRYSNDSLELRKRQVGSLIFSREFLCQPITSDSSLFPWSMLSKAFVGMDMFKLVPNIEAFPIKFNAVVTGCDFALSGSISADYTAFLTFGKDDFGNRYLLNVVHEKGLRYTDQLTKLKTIGRQFKPNVMYLENNQFQQIYTEVLINETDLPVKGYTTGREKHDLYNGVPGLVLLFENGKFRFPRGDERSIKITDAICNEFNHIGYTEKGICGVGSHDDLAMAVWLAQKAFDYENVELVLDWV